MGFMLNRRILVVGVILVLSMNLVLMRRGIVGRRTVVKIIPVIQPVQKLAISRPIVILAVPNQEIPALGNV